LVPPDFSTPRSGCAIDVLAAAVIDVVAADTETAAVTAE
jgi:hypothetical protein